MMIFSEVIAKKMPIFSKYSICQPPLTEGTATLRIEVSVFLQIIINLQKVV